MEKKGLLLLLLAAFSILGGLTMAEDAPDWHTLDWKVEATPRISLLYPSGKVISSTSFDSPAYNWQLSNPAGTTVERRTDVSFTPPAAMFIQTKAADGSVAGIYKYLGYSGTGKIGLEFAYASNAGTNANIVITLERYDATDYKHAAIKYVGSTYHWQYENSAGVDTDIPDGYQKLLLQDKTFHRVKAVVDFENTKYVELHSNEKYMDLSGLATRSNADATGAWASVGIYITAKAAAAQTLVLDNITITEE